jgi:hypothetical protein
MGEITFGLCDFILCDFLYEHDCRMNRGVSVMEMAAKKYCFKVQSHNSFRVIEKKPSKYSPWVLSEFKLSV